jgi:F0F1-type ATP synthase alpha subunit
VSRVGGNAQIKAMKKDRRHRCASTSPSTASSRPSPSSAPTSTRPRSGSSRAAALVEILKQGQYHPLSGREAGRHHLRCDAP